jgi:hypothetical protein
VKGADEPSVPLPVAFIQYNSTTDRLEFNVRLRYNVSEGLKRWMSAFSRWTGKRSLVI